MAINATGQITIVDFNDAIALTGYISSSKSLTIKYNQDDQSFNPDFSASGNSCVLSPHVFVSGGGGTDIMATMDNVKSVVWQRQTNLNSAPVDLVSGESIGTSDKKLTISINPFSATVYSISYLCTVTYTDPTTGLDTPCTSTITFNAVTQGKGTAYAEINTDDGFAFKNGTPASITLKAVLYRGDVQDADNLSYTWYKFNGSNWSTSVGTSSSLTISAGDVSSMALYRVTITDTVIKDSYTSDPCSIIDYTDPLSVTITSTGGDKFKNGSGSSTLKAVVKQNGVDVPSSQLTFLWSKLDQDGNTVPGWSKTTQSIDITSDDVNVKTTFVVTVTKA